MNNGTKVPGFIAAASCLVASALSAFLLSLVLAPTLTIIMFPGIGLEIILAIQIVFIALFLL